MSEKKYLKWYQKVAYGSGDFAAICSFVLMANFIMIYCTDVMGMNSGVIGTLILFSKVFDGITDVICGRLIDRTKSKLGKARPWMLYSQIGVSGCLVLLFAIPNTLENVQYAYFFIVPSR
jgi:GPH family glycoside/pentoside/hexuronide:cation symporter